MAPASTVGAALLNTAANVAPPPPVIAQRAVIRIRSPNWPSVPAALITSVGERLRSCKVPVWSTGAARAAPLNSPSRAVITVTMPPVAAVKVGAASPLAQFGLYQIAEVV